MRLDKFLSVTGTLSRSEAKRAVRAGRVRICNKIATSCDDKLDPEHDTVTLDGRSIIYRRYTYIMLNKPEGYVSATDDSRDKTVLDLLPEDMKKSELFPCGRLDKYTLGLMLITDDGELSHKLLAPKSHVEKSYKFCAEHAVSDADAEALRTGVHIEGGYLTKPCGLLLDEGGESGIITLREGKYHQIKQMLEATKNKIIYLERITFGSLTLDLSLARGEWRYLTEEEIEKLRADADKKQN